VSIGPYQTGGCVKPCAGLIPGGRFCEARLYKQLLTGVYGEKRWIAPYLNSKD